MLEKIGNNIYGLRVTEKVVIKCKNEIKNKSKQRALDASNSYENYKKKKSNQTRKQ